MFPFEIDKIIQKNPSLRIVDEYFDEERNDDRHKPITWEEFKQTFLQECPIEYFNNVGVDFC